MIRLIQNVVVMASLVTIVTLANFFVGTMDDINTEEKKET